ncbi:ORF6N domain-containing protein [Variovorax sp. UMC13]|uniref:ORF6N domain-containing protein n=1 Tax=Variovorax sp. UMC13 TaxID=1862326 RepID=UPI001C800E6F|nr:ORF6N domain-containing protein [Variovorax sp. UMC13]MBB1599943.1 hypothetical protein [Variovorax sp. UMC13]
MSNIVKINNTALQVIEYRGARVVTLSQVDAVHERPEGTAGRNFREHRERFVEGVDFFTASSDEIRRNNPGSIPDALRRADVILVTEQGYTMLVKPFNDDLAWDVQRKLVTRYFAAPQTAKAITSKPAPASLAYREAAAITRDHLRVCKLLGVDDGMARAVTAKQVRIATGLDFAPLLATNVTLDVPMTPSQLAERIGGGAVATHINAALRDLGMQEQHTSAGRGGKTKKKWVLTAAGEQYGAMQPYQGDGSEHSGYRPMWFARAIELIRPMLEMQGAYRAKGKEPDAAAA